MIRKEDPNNKLECGKVKRNPDRKFIISRWPIV